MRAAARLPDKVINVLLGCGMAYPVGYAVANDVVAAARYPGYSRRNQAVSELSAVGAPTRGFVNATLPVFTALTMAYGVGVWACGARRRSLRAAGAVLIASGATSVAWLPFPMSSRSDIASGKSSSNDVGHLVLTGLTVAEIVALLTSGGAAFGPKFRAYSLASAAVVLGGGALTSRQAANLSRGKPTPGMGLYERACIGSWLQWMAALAVMLLRERRPLLRD